MAHCLCGKDANVFESGKTECIDCYLQRKKGCKRE